MSHFTGFTINLWRGDTHRFKFVVKLHNEETDEDEIQDITLWQGFWFTAKLRIKDADEDAQIALDDGGGSGIERTDSVNGECLVTILPVHTIDLPSSSRDRTLYCDLQGIDPNGDVFTLLTGLILVQSDVSQRTI